MKENVIRLANFIMHNLVRILAGIFLLAGVVTISVNSGILMGFKYAYSLEDVNVNKLKRGMCVSDVLDYTYGHITSEYGLTGSKEVYVVGIGGKKHQYMLMKKNVSNTFSAFRTEFDDLPVMSMQSTQMPKSSNSLRIYGIVEKTDRDMFPFKYFENSLGMSRFEMKKTVSTEYHIQLVTKEEIEHKIVTGIWEVIIGLICVAFLVYRRRKKQQLEAEADKNIQEKRKNKNLLYEYITNTSRENSITCIELTGKLGDIRLEDSIKKEAVIHNINNWKPVGSVEVKEEDEILEVIEINFEDFTQIRIEITDNHRAKYMSQTYSIEDNDYKNIIEVINL